MITTFTRKIFTGENDNPEFFFNRIYTAGGIHFHVSVVDRSGQLYHFTMVEEYRKWRIVKGPQPPDWIMKIEEELDRTICQCMLS